MTDAYRKASVFVQNRFAGVLEETEEGYLFSYAKDLWGCRTVDLINCTTAPYYLSNLTYCTTNFSNAIVVSTFHSVPSTNL